MNYLYFFINLSKIIIFQGDENLFVPIHGYPIVSSYDFPTKYSFPKTSVGKSITKSFNMRSTAPIEFEYMIEVVQKHPAFEVEPLEGIIPFNRDAFINVSFSPKEFCTASMTIQMIISQFNSKPIICTFYGTSSPGLAREDVYTQLKLKNRLETDLNSDSFDARCFSPLALARSKRNNKKMDKRIFYRNEGEDKDVAPKVDSFIEHDGYRIPKQLNTPWSISKVNISNTNILPLTYQW